MWFGPEDPRNAALKIPGHTQSKQVGQLAAVLHAVQSTPPFAPLHIISSSKYIIDCFTKNLTSWEECGWIKIPNKEIIKPIVSHLRARGAITTFSRTTEPIGLENANSLANEGSHKMSVDILDWEPAHKFNLSGAQLSVMSQAVVYQGIQEKSQPTHRLSTVINLDITNADIDKQREQPYNHVTTGIYDIPLINLIHKGERPRRERYNYIEDGYWMLMQRCWAGNPGDRPSIAAVRLLL